MDDGAEHDMHQQDVYLPVRARLLAAQAAGDGLAGGAWFRALARSGLTGLMADADRDPHRNAVGEMLTVAEILGGFDVPASYVPLASAVRVLAREPFASAHGHLRDALDGGAPVMPALQSAPSTVRMGAGGGLKAERVGGGWRISGTKYAVPDGDIAGGFLADAKSAEGTLLFFIPADAAGLAVKKMPGVDGSALAALAFDRVELQDGFAGATGKAADDLLDDVRFAVQLGLAMQLYGQASAMLIRAGAAGCPEERVADCLMQVMLSRALSEGAAALAQAGREHALEMIAGARAAAQDAAVAAARVALPYCADAQEQALMKAMARRIIVASRIYSQNAAHMDRFTSWRQGNGAGAGVFDMFALAIPPASQGEADFVVGDMLSLLQQVRDAATQSGAMELQSFRNLLGRVELDIFAVLAARRLASMESGYSERFLEAARRRVMSQLADALLRALGSAAASEETAALQFIDAHAQ